MFRHVRLCVVGWAVTGISMDHSGFVFRTMQFQKSGMIDPEDEDTVILRHAGNYSRSDTSHTTVLLFDVEYIYGFV